jgi:hypothetical protein
LSAELRDNSQLLGELSLTSGTPLAEVSQFEPDFARLLLHALPNYRFVGAMNLTVYAVLLLALTPPQTKVLVESSYA